MGVIGVENLSPEIIAKQLDSIFADIRPDAVNLANDREIIEAVKEAEEYITGAIKANLALGEGGGPLDHLYRI